MLEADCPEESVEARELREQPLESNKTVTRRIVKECCMIDLCVRTVAYCGSQTEDGIPAFCASN